MWGIFNACIVGFVPGHLPGSPEGGHEADSAFTSPHPADTPVVTLSWQVFLLSSELKFTPPVDL